MSLVIHYMQKDREIYTAMGYSNWRSSWTPCEHLVLLGPTQTDEERNSHMEIWGSDLSERHTYTRVWCKRCAQSKGYTW